MARRDGPTDPLRAPRDDASARPREDLMELLRALDGAMRALAPPPGHEARMRARLESAAASGRASLRRPASAPSRAFGLVLAAVLVLVGVWIARGTIEPEVSVQPLPAPAPSAEISAEPVAPTATSAPPRWLPRRPVPALPILPPRSEVAPAVPSPAPRALARTDAAQDEARGPAPFDHRTPGEEEANREAPSPARTDPRAHGPAGRSGRGGDWGTATTGGRAQEGSREPAVGRMGTITGLSRSGGGAQDGPATPPVHRPGQDPATGPSDGDPAPGPECSWTAVELAPKCVPFADLEGIAAGACGAAGMVLSEVAPGASCGDGATFSAAKVRCCEADDSTDPLAACKPVSAGDGLTCSDAAALMKEADALCLSWGGSLVQPELVVPPGCGAGTALLATGQCCPAPDPGPSPAGAVGDGLECLQDDVLEEMAWLICQEQGLSLVDFFAPDDCGDDASTSAKYLCGG